MVQIINVLKGIIQMLKMKSMYKITDKQERQKKNKTKLLNNVMCAVFERTHFNLPFQVKISNNFDGIFQTES